MAGRRKVADLSFGSGRVLVGSCLERLRDLPDASVDSVVTDPPYELGFMGKAWDASGVAYNVELWREVLRVLKPGGHLLAFGGTRTYHRMAVAIEDAGFEIRDSIHWIYGSGFPKSLDVSKAIDKAAGAERQVVETRRKRGLGGSNTFAQDAWTQAQRGDIDLAVTAPATEQAKQWQGWGTALKPAHEPVVVARKPLDGTVAANVLAHGTGALNIDGCRIGTDDTRSKSSMTALGQNSGWNSHKNREVIAGSASGRWPANVIFDEAAGAELGEPARFFYCAKASKQERNAGLDGLPEKRPAYEDYRPNTDAKGGDTPYAGANRGVSAKNFHPTVKPVALIRYLVRLVTPPGGTVLDPFLGSGTTAVAAVLEGFQWVGCEMTADYLPIIDGRVRHAQGVVDEVEPTLFGDNQ